MSDAPSDPPDPPIDAAPTLESAQPASAAPAPESAQPASAATAPDTARFLALARKYRTLAAVRREKERTGEHTPRDTMRALAREFPGSLRELDTLPLPEIDRRATALSAAALDPDRAEPWMRWMAAYHLLTRAALFIKAQLRGARTVDAEVAAQLAARASVHVALVLEPFFARACASPPAGRLASVVLDELSARFAEPADVIARALFPRRPTRAEVDAALAASSAK